MQKLPKTYLLLGLRRDAMQKMHKCCKCLFCTQRVGLCLRIPSKQSAKQACIFKWQFVYFLMGWKSRHFITRNPSAMAKLIRVKPLRHLPCPTTTMYWNGLKSIKYYFVFSFIWWIRNLPTFSMANSQPSSVLWPPLNYRVCSSGTILQSSLQPPNPCLFVLWSGRMPRIHRTWERS